MPECLFNHVVVQASLSRDRRSKTRNRKNAHIILLRGPFHEDKMGGKWVHYLARIVAIGALNFVDRVTLLVKSPLSFSHIQCLTGFLALEIGGLISKGSWFLWLDLKQNIELCQILKILLSYLVTTVITTIRLLMRGPIGIMRSSVGLFRSDVT